MKLFVHKGIPCFVAVMWAVSLYAQSSCKCFPDPPDGKTMCDESQIAVCGRADDSQGCSGLCFTVDQNLSPVEYAAFAVSYISGRDVTKNIIKSDAVFYKKIIRNMLMSNSTGNPTTLVFGEKKISISVGLPAVAVDKFRMTLDEIGH